MAESADGKAMIAVARKRLMVRVFMRRFAVTDECCLVIMQIQAASWVDAMAGDNKDEASPPPSD
jgi:hypothetical protein